MNARTDTRRWRTVGGVLAGALLAFGIGETLGWPFLRAPVERWLSARLDRSVSLFGADGASAFRLRLLGGVHVQTPRLVVGSPAWSLASAMLEAERTAKRWRPAAPSTCRRRPPWPQMNIRKSAPWMM